MSALPIFIYDGHCSFCLMWLDYVKALLGETVEWLPFESARSRFPQLELGDASVYIAPDGSVFPGAAGIFELLALAPGRAWPLWLYRHVPLFGTLADWIYGVVAAHRSAALRLARFSFGRSVSPLDYRITESLFMRLLGVVFFTAFTSFRVQIVGLLGSHGVLPVSQMMTAMRSELGSRAFLLAPSVLWLDSGDGLLIWVCNWGILASVLLFCSGWLGAVWQRIWTCACFALYLSITSIGQPFTLFQWDALLTESAFLALFIGSPLLVWAYRFLTFRLMFESGMVKLLSGDENWRNLHALRFHFVTQPLPNPLAWYASHAPVWLLDGLTFLTLAIELVCPLLLFFPRRIRHAGAGLLIALQICILLTGNYAFFNLLSIGLCLWAFDDRSLAWFKPALGRTAVTLKGSPHRVANVLVAFLLLLGVQQIISQFMPSLGRPFRPIMSLVGPWQIVNSYGLFAVMTTARPEIIFEGSDDGQSWKEYVLPYKPGPVNRTLPVVAPHQPRLDWQLWFAALDGSYQQDPWTLTLAARLLQGEPTVLALFDAPPFSKPPRYVRASLYNYWFTTSDERNKTGAIWNRQFERSYLPQISLDMLKFQNSVQ